MLKLHYYIFPKIKYITSLNSNVKRCPESCIAFKIDKDSEHDPVPVSITLDPGTIFNFYKI